MGENENDYGEGEANGDSVGGVERERERGRDFLLQTGLGDLITVKTLNSYWGGGDQIFFMRAAVPNCRSTTVPDKSSVVLQITLCASFTAQKLCKRCFITSEEAVAAKRTPWVST